MPWTLAQLTYCFACCLNPEGRKFTPKVFNYNFKIILLTGHWYIYIKIRYSFNNGIIFLHEGKTSVFFISKNNTKMEKIDHMIRQKGKKKHFVISLAREIPHFMYLFYNVFGLY